VHKSDCERRFGTEQDREFQLESRTTAAGVRDTRTNPTARIRDTYAKAKRTLERLYLELTKVNPGT